MNKARRYREQVLDEAFFGDPIPWARSAQAFEISLHTAEPQDAAGRLTAEVAYPRYQRAVLARDRATWRRGGNRMVNVAEARFPLCQEGGETLATHWAMTPAGHDAPAYAGKLQRPLRIEPGIRPVIDPEAIEVVES